MAVAAAAEPALRGPIVEVEHPRYRDANGVPMSWKEVKRIAKRSDAMGRVRSRRLGRTVLRVVFAGTTAVEAYGAWRLSQERSAFAVPLGAQASVTGLCGVLLWTSMPRQRAEDRQMILQGANGVLVPVR